MRSSSLTRWAGPAGIAGGILWIGGSLLFMTLGGGQQEAEPYAITHMGVYQLSNLVLGLAVLLSAVGLVGLYNRQQQRSGAMGKLAAALAYIAGVAAILHLLSTLTVGALGTAGVGLVWMSQTAGVLTLTLGLILLGITTWRAHVLHRWSGVPLATGILGIALSLVGNVLGSANVLLLIGAVLFGLGWVLTGYELWAEAADTKRQPRPAL